MNLDTVVFIYTTYPEIKTAHRIVSSLLEKKLIACGHVFALGTSFYFWKDALCTESEVIGILKTKKALLEPLEKRYTALHPYECPCFLSWEALSGYAPYLKWMEGVLKK